MQYLHRYIINLILFLLVIGIELGICSITYVPQIEDPLLEPWRWQQFTELDGKGCRCMTEDKNSSLWFGTNNGVLQYNGQQWQSFPFIDDSSNTSVVSILAASDNSIYAGTNKGIRRLVDGIWQYIDLNLGYADSLDFPHNELPILETSDKSIWIGTHYGALRVRDKKITLYREFNVFPNLQDRSPEYIESEILSLPQFDIFSIMEANDKKIWFGLRNGDLYRSTFYSINMITSPRWEKFDDKSGYVKSNYPIIKQTKNGSIYIINGQNSNSTNIYNNSSWHQINFNIMFSGVGDIHADILESEDGTLWISGVGRLFLYRDNEWQLYELPKLPLPSSRLKLFETSNNGIWIIGLYNEVWKIDFSDQRWATYNGLNFQCDNQSGDNWFISEDFNVVKCDSSMKNWICYDETDGLMDAPNRIILTKNDMVWVSGSHKQIAATAFLNDGKWHLQTHPTLSWSFEMRAAFETNDGSLWFGVSPDYKVEKGQHGGLLYIPQPSKIKENPKQHIYYYFNQHFPINGVYGIGQGYDNQLYVGQMGLYGLSDSSNSWSEITGLTGLKKQFIDCMHTSPEGDIWVGCRTNGIFWLNRHTHKWTNFTTQNGLSGNTIVSILAQSDTSVWVITDQNICHFDGYSWTTNIFPKLFKVSSNGGTILNAKNNTLWINQQHRSWHRFPLNRTVPPSDQFTRFRTLRYRSEYNPPETVVTYFQEKIQQPANMFISWIGHDPWKLTPNNHLEYSYRLDNEQWSPYTTETSRNFLNIGDGKHTFEVKARDCDFNIDPSPAKINFRVIPPVWRQAWFIGLISLFIITIAIFIYYIIRRDQLIQELSATKARLFTNIAHELRTPLTLIIGPLQKVINSIDKKDKWHEQMHLMHRNSNRLMRLINQIMDFQKSEAKQLQFEPDKADITHFIYETITSFQPIADEKQIDFSVKSNIDEMQMWFDADKVEKILFNILSNAFKFTPVDGKVSVYVTQIQNDRMIEKSNETYKKIKYKNWIEISIKDSGIGIPKEKIKRIFDRFYQANDPTVAHIGGTGIGLSLTKNLLDLHFGEFAVKSIESEGSLFTIKLPIITDIVFNTTRPVNTKSPTPFNTPQLPGVSETSPAISNNTNSTKVLIVEDDPDMRTFIRCELEEDYNIQEAKDGQAGFDQTIEFMPDLIISDVMMPYVDGLEFCGHLKTDERTSHIPVILLTAKSSQINKIQGLETGADDYITKPFHSEELKIRIQNLIESRRKLRERFSRDLRIEPNEITITSVDEQLLKRAIDIVEEHMNDQDFNVETFSKKMFMSRVTLYNKLKSLTNSSVQEFIFIIRLKRAAQLLKSSGMNITQIAFEVGFKDSSHFSKLFKKQFGKSPSVYQKENK